MAAKKGKRRAKKAASKKKPARKQAAPRKRDANSGTGDIIVDAARRRWLSVESWVTSEFSSLPGPARKPHRR
jgi:hypothetical protein